MLLLFSLGGSGVIPKFNIGAKRNILIRYGGTYYTTDTL